jgi:hypothetical protein
LAKKLNFDAILSGSKAGNSVSFFAHNDLSAIFTPALTQKWLHGVVKERCVVDRKLITFFDVAQRNNIKTFVSGIW